MAEQTQQGSPKREEPAGTEDESWRGTVGKIAGEELDAFLGGNLVCRLACLKEDGAPYVVPCWFEWTGKEFYIIPRKRSAWARYLQRDGRVCLNISGDTPPYKQVQVEGMAEVVEEPNVGGQWVPIARRMSLRYLGEHGPDYLVPTLDQPRWLIRVTPSKLTTWQGVAWHPRYFEEGTQPTPSPTV